MSKRAPSLNRKKAGRKPTDLTYDFEVEFVEMEEDHIEEWRAGIRLLLELLHQEKEELEKEIKKKV